MEDLSNNLPLNLNLLVRRIVEKENFINYEIESRPISSDGGGYLGIMYEINVSGRTKDGEKKLQLFAKHIIDGTDIKRFSVKDVYVIELFAYKELFKIYAELQEIAKVPIAERYEVVKIYEESNAEVLIMENMAKRGFTSYRRTEIASLNFFETVVRQLAKFHGLSFVVREKRPDFFNEKIKPLKYPYFFNEAWRQAIVSLKDVSINYVNEEFKDKLEELYETLINKYEQYCNDEIIQVCLCHGDYRPCNFMVKEDRGHLQEVIPLDFQMMHYGCPVFDFLYLIFIGTDRDFRKKNLTNLKELYYETLSTFLRYFDLDVEVVYPRKDFEKVYREKLDFGLMCSLTYLPIILAANTDLPDFTQSKMSFRCDDVFKDRLRDLIQDFGEWGFI